MLTPIWQSELTREEKKKNRIKQNISAFNIAFLIKEQLLECLRKIGINRMLRIIEAKKIRHFLWIIFTKERVGC